MDTRTPSPFQHDYRAFPAVKGLRQRPSCRVSDFLVEPISTDTLFSLVEKASHRNSGPIVRALLSLRNPRKRLSRANMLLLRAFQPIVPLINWPLMASLDAQNFIIWRHNAIIRMVAGQRSVGETMRLLHLAPAESLVARVAVYETAQAALEADMPF